MRKMLLIIFISVLISQVSISEDKVGLEFLLSQHKIEWETSNSKEDKKRVRINVIVDFQQWLSREIKDKELRIFLIQMRGY